MAITLNPKQFMQKEIVEGVANKQLEANLDFINLFDIIPTDATAVTYAQDVTNAGDDLTSGTMGEPLDLGELSGLSKVEISPISHKSGMLNPFGFKIEVSERDLTRSAVIDDLTRAVDRGMFAMADKINTDIISTIQGVTNDITEVSGYKVWSDDAADPIGDIISFQKAFRVEGFPYKLTDLFVHSDNFFEAASNLVGKGIVSPLGSETEIPSILGTQIRSTGSAQVSEGSYIGIDSREGYRPVSVYAFRDPKYAEADAFPLVTVNQYQEQGHPKNIVTEFVAEVFPALKVPNACCYKSSGI